jgi:hypothetical protein
MSDDTIAKLDVLEKVATEAVARTYSDGAFEDMSVEERFWIQKGIEGMRYAVALMWEGEGQ